MTRLKDVKIPHLTFMQNGSEVNLGQLYAEDGKIYFKNAADVIIDLTETGSMTKAEIDALLINAATLDSHDSLYFAKQSDLDILADVLEPSTLLTNIKTVDGAGSGLDADLLDGQQGAYYATASTLTTHQADITTHTNFASQVTTPLAGKAATVHTHAQSDVTNLTTDLASKPTGAAATAMWNADKILGATIPALSNVGALTSNGTTLSWTPGGGGGEVNTASNLGAGTGLYSAKSGVDLQFKSLTASGRAVLTTPVTGEINIGTSAVLADSDITDGSTKVMMLATERTKLTNIATAATANDTDANLKARANHTGTQLASTISDFTSSVTAIAAPTPDTTSITSGITTHALVIGNANKTIICQNTGALTITIPTNASVAFAAGTTITFLRHATGSVTISQVASAVTMNGSTSTTKVISTQHKWASLYYVGSNVWNLSGDIA